MFKDSGLAHRCTLAVASVALVGLLMAGCSAQLTTTLSRINIPRRYALTSTPLLSHSTFPAGELAFLKLYLLKLKDNIRSVVRQHSANTKLVDIESLVKGQSQWCGKDPWIYGPSIASPFDYPGNKSPFHPTPYAQTVIANMVTAAVKAHFKL